MNPEMMISVVILIGLIAIPLVPPLLVLRGRRFWAPWTMVGAVVLFALTMGGSIGFQFYLSKKMQTISVASGGSGYESAEWNRILDLMQIASLVGGGMVVVACLVYAVGLWGVASRWKEISRRAKELETRTADLAAQRDAVA